MVNSRGNLLDDYVIVNVLVFGPKDWHDLLVVSLVEVLSEFVHFEAKVPLECVQRILSSLFHEIPLSVYVWVIVGFLPELFDVRL